MTRPFARVLEDIEMEDDDFDPSEKQFSYCPGETKALIGYALNALTALDHAQPEASLVIEWLHQQRTRLELDDTAFRGMISRNRRSQGMSATRRQSFRKLLRARYHAMHDASGPATRGLAAVCEALGLDELDATLLGIIFRYQTDNGLERLFDLFSKARHRPTMLRAYAENFAILTNRRPQDAARRFLPSSPLALSGCILIDDDDDLVFPDRLRGLIYACGQTGDSMRANLLGKPMTAKLPWDSFSHLGPETGIARRLLRSVLDAQGAERAVHILLYGPPGTGKTEFAATLARELSVPLYAIGESNERGAEPNRGERLNDMLMAQRVSGGESALYLFDEAEDIFRAGLFERNSAPKIFIHRLIESAHAPVIWTANDITAFSPAVLRRMSLCLEVKLPERRRRAELWQELAEAEGVNLDTRTADELAGMIPTAPAVARTALRAARLAGGEVQTVARVTRGLAKAMGHGVLPRPEAADLPEIYDPTFSRANADLSMIISRFTRLGATRAVSLLLSGPPGTGKSAFARHLAKSMGLDVLQKRGSDIFGSYVGETERNIAAAFAEARDEGKFLIFDEVDSLLAGRERAQRNWEISQVNEMLTWMETHPQPFVCTTNLPEALDTASLRRFLFHVRFDYLSAEQTARLFTKTFGLLAPERLSVLDRLTPADFSRVAKRLAVLDDAADPSELLSQLTSEMESRSGPSRQVGFGRSS